MRVPVKMMWPIRLDPSANYAFTVEDNIRLTSAIYNPLLRFYNTNLTGDMQLIIEHTLDLGFGDDPLYSGSWTFTVVDEQIPPISLRDYAFTPQIDLDDTVITRHTITVTNLSAVEEKIVRLILFGDADVQAQLPAGQQIIKAQAI